MGLQLIFVVETNKKCNSDWIYIKETIENFFDYDNTQIKLSRVYLSGKGNYNSKTAQRDIDHNRSEVLYCADCDEYDNQISDKNYLVNIQKFCKDRGHKFTWFCKDIERVYVHKKVEDNQKKKESERFKARKSIRNVEVHRLKAGTFQNNTSNIVGVLDQFYEFSLKQTFSKW